MSIEKDVEKLYKGDIEKQKKNQKKKKSQMIGVIYIILKIQMSQLQYLSQQVKEKFSKKQWIVS